MEEEKMTWPKNKNLNSRTGAQIFERKNGKGANLNRKVRKISKRK
jgi:hypothetical protein